MPDYIALGTDVALAVISFTGAYYAFVASELFKGDLIMEKVWRLSTTAFAILAFFAVFDFLLTLVSSPLDWLHLVRLASVFAIGIFVFAVIMLVSWGRSPTESRTQR